MHNQLLLGLHGGTMGEKSTGLTDSKDSRQMFVGAALLQSNAQIPKENILSPDKFGKYKNEAIPEVSGYLSVSKNGKDNVHLLSNGDESSVDVNAFEEKIQNQEKQPYYMPPSKQQDRTKQLFYVRNFIRPVFKDQLDSQVREISEEDDNKEGQRYSNQSDAEDEDANRHKSDFNNSRMSLINKR